MKFHEAMEKIQNGGKVRKYNWNKDCYLHLNEKNEIVDEEGRAYYFVGHITDDWEEYIEFKDNRIEVTQVYKDLYRVVKQCMKTPIEEDIILQWIGMNDFKYSIDELDIMLNLMNLKYKLDE